MENNHIDKLVKDAIGEYEVSYNANDWDFMSAQLDEASNARKRLFVIKGVEFVLMGFALWTVTQFIQPELQSSPNERTKVIPVQIESDDSQILPVSTESLETKQQDEIKDKAQPPDKDKILLDATFARLTKPSDSKAKRQLSEQATVERQNAENLFLTKKSTLIEKTLHETTKDLNNLLFELPENLQTKEDENSTIKIETLEGLPFASLEYREELNIPILNEDIDLRPAKDRGLKVSTYLSPDFNQIKTPEIVNVSKQSTALSLAAGIGVVYEISPKWSIESGVAFVPLQYNERTRYDFGNGVYSVNELTNTQLNIVEIPVNAHYNFSIQDSKWNVYAVTGLTNRFVTSIRDIPQEFKIAAPLTGIFTDQSSVEFTTQSNADPRGATSIDGIFEKNDNRLEGNYYLTANLGFGVERSFGKRLSLFMQPVYKRALTKIGRHEDKISTIALSTGARIAL